MRSHVAARDRRVVEHHAAGHLEDDARHRVVDVVPGRGHTGRTADTGTGSSGRRRQGEQRITPAAAAPAAPAGIQGQITFAAKGDAYPDVASWIRTVGDTNVMPSLTGLWVTGATAGDAETDSSVGFDSTANLTDAARSNRLEKYQGENQ